MADINSGLGCPAGDPCPGTGCPACCPSYDPCGLPGCVMCKPEPSPASPYKQLLDAVMRDEIEVRPPAQEQDDLIREGDPRYNLVQDLIEGDSRTQDRAAWKLAQYERDREQD